MRLFGGNYLMAACATAPSFYSLHLYEGAECEINAQLAGE